MFFVQRIWNWCKRFRYRCGYGVHSPSDFYLITSVIYEDLPYYAYKTLKDASSSKGGLCYREKVNRLLFRLINYFHPSSVIELGRGNGNAFRYMQAARPSMVSESFMALEKEETTRSLKPTLDKMGKVDFLHVAYTPYGKELFEQVYPYLHAGSCVIIGNIYASKEREEWWRQLKSDERVRITFDLYDIGLILFDAKRFKQNYIVNFF